MSLKVITYLCDHGLHPITTNRKSTLFCMLKKIQYYAKMLWNSCEHSNEHYLNIGVHCRLWWVHNEVTQSEAEALWSAAQTKRLRPWPGKWLFLQLKEHCWRIILIHHILQRDMNKSRGISQTTEYNRHTDPDFCKLKKKKEMLNFKNLLRFLDGRCATNYVYWSPQINWKQNRSG